MIKVAAVVWRGMIFGIGKNNGRESTANGDNGADPAMQTANPLKSLSHKISLSSLRRKMCHNIELNAVRCKELRSEIFNVNLKGGYEKFSRSFNLRPQVKLHQQFNDIGHPV